MGLPQSPGAAFGTPEMCGTRKGKRWSCAVEAPGCSGSASSAADKEGSSSPGGRGWCLLECKAVASVTSGASVAELKPRPAPVDAASSATALGCKSWRSSSQSSAVP